MNSIIFYFLPGILVLGIITSIEDIKSGKIRNKWIIWAFIYSLCLHSLLYLIQPTLLSADYFPRLFLNFIFKRHIQSGPVGDNLVIFNLQVQLYNLGDSQVPQAFARGLYGVLRRILPGHLARSHQFDDFVSAH